ncbi:acyltransferase family protein [Aurantimicrobium sp. INA4]|uniref:acyltransferase family protein n=1 Tax=Aurantimicrobium sp. INA4 TaxID=2986279 RepID=UPI002492DAD9|nr:acyltransferase family protein [Aurantimicrobium sp. INA4]
MQSLLRLNNSKNYRSDIQVLRGLSVVGVVVFHFWPNLLPGGFIGVDVFFVISGFLMTEYLYPRALIREKSLLSTFWFRRFRRILPLAIFVSCVSMVLSLLTSPVSVQKSNFLDFLGSLSFSLNLIFQNRQVDYLSNDALPSMFQQYWSLAIEEQFYFVFPLALLLFAFGTSFLKLKSTNVLGIFLICAWSVSFCYSVSAYITGTNLYFSSLARFWELLSGALVYLAYRFLEQKKQKIIKEFYVFPLLISLWIGLILCIFLIKPSETYPGFHALFPVLFTSIIILIGSLHRTTTNQFLVVIEMIGLLSFGIYLWHWPLFVTASYIGFEGPINNIYLLIVTCLFSMATFYLIEEPMRKWSPKKNRVKLAVLSSVAIFVIVAFCATQILPQASSAKVAWTEQGICSGANAIGNLSCKNNNVVENFEKLASGGKDLDPNWCLVEPTNDWKSCTYFDQYSNGIAIVGDSHAAALIPAMKVVASKDKEFLKTYTRFGCPGISSRYFEATFHDSVYWEQCTEWSKRVLQEISENEQIDKVIFAGWYSSYPDDNVSKEVRLSEDKVKETFDSLLSKGKQIYVVTDVPDTGGINIPDCIIAAGKGAIDPCSIDGSIKQLSNVVLTTARTTQGVTIIDLYSHICPQINKCSSVIGGIPIYADTNHLSDSFSRTLGLFFHNQLSSNS